MPTPRLEAQESRWRPVMEAYARHVAAGAAPIGGKPSPHGQSGAIDMTAAELGIDKTGARRLLATGLHEVARMRGEALQGVGHGPPIPAAGMPPEGFVVASNAATYDGAGNLKAQHVKHRPAAGAAYVVPAGHTVKGESALIDPAGNILARWIKTREGAGEGLIDALSSHFEAHRGTAPLPALPTMAADDLLTVYPLPDLHLGMYAWKPETGDNYDIGKAVRDTERHMAQLVAQSQPSRRAVVLGLGDYFHANDAKGVTPGSGHQLDVDGRWPKVYAAGVRLACAVVEMAAQKHETVEVVFLPGNHDPDAAVTLTVALGLYYAGNARITVYQEPGIAWYRQFGRVLIGATHGHTMKPDRMAMMLATDQAEGWGSSDHRHFFFGHVHHESAKDVAGVRVESFSSPAPRDAWNNSKGYRPGRALQAITFHRLDGEIGRHRVNLTTTKHRVRVRANGKKEAS